MGACCVVSQHGLCGRSCRFQNAACDELPTHHSTPLLQHMTVLLATLTHLPELHRNASNVQGRQGLEGQGLKVYLVAGALVLVTGVVHHDCEDLLWVVADLQCVVHTRHNGSVRVSWEVQADYRQEENLTLVGGGCCVPARHHLPLPLNAAGGHTTPRSALTPAFLWLAHLVNALQLNTGAAAFQGLVLEHADVK